MFRKYYREANEDIKIDETLVDRVIANAHKKNPPARGAYYKYALPAAAAVLIVSAAVVSMPVWQKAEDDSGVIIEESVTRTSPPQNDENIPQPNKSPDSDAAPIHDYDSSQNAAKNEMGKKEELTKKPDNDYSSSKKTVSPRIPVFSEPSEERAEKKSVTETRDKENAEISSSEQKSGSAPTEKENTVRAKQDKSDFAAFKAAAAPETENEETAEAMPSNDEVIYGDAGSYSAADSFSAEYAVGSVYKEADTDSTAPASPRVFSSYISEDSETAEKSLASGGSSSASNITAGVMKINTAAPSGYYVTYEDGQNVTYESESGSEIYVNSDYGDYSDSDVVYNDSGDVITANFAENGVNYDITAYNAEMSSVEEVVDILR